MSWEQRQGGRRFDGVRPLGFVVGFRELLGEVRWVEVRGFEDVQTDSSVAVLE